MNFQSLVIPSSALTLLLCVPTEIDNTLILPPIFQSLSRLESMAFHYYGSLETSLQPTQSILPMKLPRESPVWAFPFTLCLKNNTQSCWPDSFLIRTSGGPLMWLGNPNSPTFPTSILQDPLSLKVSMSTTSIPLLLFFHFIKEIEIITEKKFYMHPASHFQLIHHDSQYILSLLLLTRMDGSTCSLNPIYFSLLRDIIPGIIPSFTVIFFFFAHCSF